MDYIKMNDLVEKLELIDYTPEMELEDRRIYIPEVNRPGIQLTGFFKKFQNKRVQVMGNVEILYLNSLKKLTGNNRKVRDYVMKNPLAKDFVSRVVGLALDTIPGYIKEGKYSLVIAIGCTGGQHRSVACVNELADHFRELGKHVMVIHRDL